ncbi:MAG: AlpA family phage regulatory protein [Magnetococcales bacterium]|nr:AlpA family phage regulatory protein [Magnetococcales bacterium]
MPEQTPIDHILSKKTVIQMTSVPRGTLDHWISKGQFPPPVALGPCRVGWRASTIQAWIDSRPIANRVLPTTAKAPGADTIQGIPEPVVRRRGRPSKVSVTAGQQGQE